MQKSWATSKQQTFGEASLSLSLPEDFVIEQRLESGFRSVVYQAQYRGKRVILKVYKPAYDAKCRQRAGMSAAQFEYERNQSFYRNPDLRRYVARPLHWLKSADGWTESFAQEYIEGLSLSAYRKQIGKISVEFANQIERICKIAWSADLFDLDLHNHNVMAVRKDEKWQPMLFDFNMLPKEVGGRLLTRMMFHLGLRDPAYRDRRWLKQLFERDLAPASSDAPLTDDSQIVTGRFLLDR